MPRISQRALVEDALDYMEKSAAGKGPKVMKQSNELVNLLSRILRGSGTNLSTPNGASTPMADILTNAVNKQDWGSVDNISNSIIGTLRKKLEQREISKARKLVGENKDILSETGKVLMEGGGSGKNQGLGGAAGAGAGVGALAGAFQDTDEENTNMLGITQKRKGGLGARLKNMAMGAAAGGAIGAGLKAKGVAKKNIGDSVKEVSRSGRAALNNMRDEDILSKALSDFSPMDIEGDISKAMSKVYQKMQKGQGKFKDRDFNTLMDNALFSGTKDIRGIDPKYNGVLERTWDRISGGNARRKATADDTLNALISLAPMSDGIDGELVNGLRLLKNTYGNNSIEALKELRKNPIKYIPDETNMDNFKKILRQLTTDNGSSQFGKAFRKRNKGIAVPWSDTVYRPEIPVLDHVLDWVFGKKSPERLQNYFDEVIGNVEI